MRFARLLLPLAAALGFAAHAGTVNVSFADPNAYNYIDAGNSRWDEKSNLDALAAWLGKLGAQWLPADQQLKVELLDVDLAGSVRPSRLDGSSLRTVRGRNDFPRFHLRYTLESNGKVVRTADEWISDLNYTRGISSVHQSENLYYEKRLLQNWFKQRFVPMTASR
jgi:hypothetical protein